MVKIINSLLPSVKYPLKSPFNMDAETLTVHNTYNDASAQSEINFMKSNSSPTSFHIAVDDKEAIVGIPLNRNAFAAGDGANGPGNRKSIHIEICYSKSGGYLYKKAEANAIELIVRLLKERNWGIDRVRYHKDWSGKNCPHRILDEGRGVSFKDEIEKALKEANKPSEVKGVSKMEEYKRDDKPSASLAAEFEEAIAEGLTDGTYPQRPMTREEGVVIALRVLKASRK